MARCAILPAMKCRPCGSGFQPRSSRQDAAPTVKNGQLHWKSNFGVALHHYPINFKECRTAAVPLPKKMAGWIPSCHFAVVQAELKLTRGRAYLAGM